MRSVSEIRLPNLYCCSMIFSSSYCLYALILVLLAAFDFCVRVCVHAFVCMEFYLAIKPLVK